MTVGHGDSRWVDPHVHLWDKPGSRYLIDDLHRDLAQVPQVGAVVFVECLTSYRSAGPQALRSLGETEFATDIAHTCGTGPPIAAIVANVDLTADCVADILGAHKEAARGLLRGVRHPAAWDPSPRLASAYPTAPDLLEAPSFQRGLRCLGDAGLAFDAWVYHPQLPSLRSLVAKLDDVVFVVNHLGGPVVAGHDHNDAAESRLDWAREMRHLAAHENVVVKLGGVGLPIFRLEGSDAPLSAEDLVASWRVPIRDCIEWFGAERCMFESNFPVDKRSGVSYSDLWQAFHRIVDDFSPHERSALFAGTAERVYQIVDNGEWS